MACVDLQRRVIGDSVTKDRRGQITGVDFDLLIQRLLFYDGYVLRTVRFKEIPFIVNAFGVAQTTDLLRCGLIDIRCEVLQTGSLNDPAYRNNPKPTFELVWVDAHDWDEYLESCLADLRNDLQLPAAEWGGLEVAIRDRIVRISTPIKSEMGECFTSTLDSSPSVLEESIRLAARRRRIPLVLPKFKFDVKRVGDVVQVETDLHYTRISRQELWEVVRDGLLGIGSVSLAIGEMKNYNAIGGFSPEELPVYERKFSALAKALVPHQEERFTRVVKITGLPRFDPSGSVLKLSKLLRIRESDDLRSFRDWLANSDTISNKEIHDLLRGVRARTSVLARSGAASLVRWMVETAVGLHSTTTGAALTALDSFLVERFFPRSGPAAFVNKSYPSIFERKKIE